MTGRSFITDLMKMGHPVRKRISYVDRPGGVRIGYVVLGKEFLGRSRPLALINGLAGVMTDWEVLAVELARTRCILLHDNRGLGHSSFTETATDRTITIGAAAGDIRAICEELCWNELDFLAWSYGAAIVQYLLLQTDFLQYMSVPHVIFSAGSVKIPDSEPGVTEALVKMYAMLDAADADSYSEAFLGVLQAGVEAYFDRRFCLAKKDILHRWISKVKSTKRPISAIGGQASSGVGVDFSSNLGHFPSRTKLMVIQGNKDRITLPHEVLPFLSVPNVVVPPVGSGPAQLPNYDFGHAWWEYFNPEKWAGLINNFLNDDPLYDEIRDFIATSYTGKGRVQPQEQKRKHLL